jgi:hypothetical protein
VTITPPSQQSATPAEKPLYARYGSQLRWMGVMYVSLGALETAFGSRSDQRYGLAAFWLLAGAAWLCVPVTQLDAQGVRLWTARGRRRRIVWCDVRAVLTPPTWEVNRVLRVRLADGEVVLLRNVPTDRAQAIAELTGAPLEVYANAPPPRPMSGPFAVQQQDRELSGPELSRRFAELAARHDRLQQQLRPGSVARGVHDHAHTD